jgi:hypothetical protein
LAHSATQFKTYSVIALMTHMQRAFYGRGGISRPAYSLILPLFLTMGGAAVIALKDLANGKDPEDMTKPKFWGRAFVQGGGAGMAGDFISAGLKGDSRTGGTIGGYVAGPTMAAVLDPAIRLTLGNTGEAFEGKNTNFASEAEKLARDNLPGGSLWYAKLGVGRLLLDQLDEVADPKINARRARMAKSAQEQGTQFWWAPGETQPRRAPAPRNAIGERP